MFWRKKKNKKDNYICSECGEIHEEWPALAYTSPSSYFNLDEEEKKTIATLNSDFSTIKYPDQTDRFIRVVLKQRVIDYDDFLEYGLWASLSEKSFTNYSDNYKNSNHEKKYFGWLANLLPDYHFIENIPTTVVTKPGNERPEIFPHEDFDHPFVKDYYNGITKEEAEKRIHKMLKNL